MDDIAILTKIEFRLHDMHLSPEVQEAPGIKYLTLLDRNIISRLLPIRVFLMTS